MGQNLEYNHLRDKARDILAEIEVFGDLNIRETGRLFLRRIAKLSGQLQRMAKAMELELL